MVELLLGSANSRNSINCIRTPKLQYLGRRAGETKLRLPSFRKDEARHDQLGTSGEVQAPILGHSEPRAKHHLSPQFFHPLSHDSIAHLEEIDAVENVKFGLRKYILT